ncbi:MAG: hypothetical protein ACK55I_16675, partial [bacterium]
PEHARLDLPRPVGVDQDGLAARHHLGDGLVARILVDRRIRSTRAQVGLGRVEEAVDLRQALVAVLALLLGRLRPARLHRLHHGPADDESRRRAHGALHRGPAVEPHGARVAGDHAARRERVRHQ